MKPISVFFLGLIFSFTATSFNTLNAQIRVGGTIDINIDIPEVVVVNRTPRRAPQPKRRPPVVIEKRHPEPSPSCNCDTGFGVITQQNSGPRFDYHVVDATVEYFRDKELNLVLHFDTGDVAVISMIEYIPNDYNFHFNCNSHVHGNSILDIRINNASIPLNNASVSLQPKGSHGFSAVLNIHTKFDGDFNGSVEF